MVTLAGNLSFSPEFEKMKEKLQNARKNYTDLIEEYSLLIGVVGDNLETEYMLKLGKKEHELFSCQVEIMRLKREISLFQAARNRGETIPSEEVLKIIEKEFAAYLEQLEEQSAKLELAGKRFTAEKLSPEEISRIKKLYRDLIRRLHPDLNPDLPPGAKSLWENILEAYKNNDWDELTLLADMADEMLKRKKDFVETISSFDRLKQELDKVIRKTVQLSEQIAATRERVPYVYEKILCDPAAVLEKRQHLDAEIKLCRKRIRELKKIRKTFGG